MITLKAEKRDIFGKKLEGPRREGKMPVVMYGAKEATMPLFVNGKEFAAVLKRAGETSVISLHVGSEEKDVIIHDVALDPRTDAPIHADLYAVSRDQKLQVQVPLVFQGVAPAQKSLGGVLIKVLHEIEIEALPRNLPHELTVDISVLATFDDHITVKDIKLPAGVTLISPSADEIVASVAAPKEEVEEATPTAIDFDKIQVQERGKKEDAEGAAAEAA